MKKLITIIMMVVAVFLFAGCGNKMVFDTVNEFDYAIVSFPDGTSKTIELKVWKDYDGEQLQIVAKDGTVYLINSVNCVLVKE